ncbi:MaoC family dehydratase [Fodinicurvata sediminis]|uniref:MaoC family dehydratase n=1 Tax=Fodinicurvata sediminis TaxID=1121832 RepID=UPI0003B42264|nr:MaoC family dehydratase [Fodinicurvata sediminis]
MSDKAFQGNFFEDFTLGQEIRHATPRTVTEGDAALYMALTGSRFALHSSADFAVSLGLDEAPLDDLLVFHVVFGKSVPDISLNAVANLGYAECRFGIPVYPGDTLTAYSQVIGLKQTSAGNTGIVYVQTTGVNQLGEPVLDFKRWVLVNKRDPDSPAPQTQVPELADAVAAEDLVLPEGLNCAGYDGELAGSPYFWEDYAVGERIDHGDAMTLEEAEHQMATRLYQNTARVHFDQLAANSNRFGRRIVYGGHVISLVRALSFNGLGNAVRIAAINGGRHVSPTFAGHTLFAWSEVLEKMELPGRNDLAALRLRSVGAKDRPCTEFPDKDEEGKPDPCVVLDLDYTVLMPRRG